MNPSKKSRWTRHSATWTILAILAMVALSATNPGYAAKPTVPSCETAGCHDDIEPISPPESPAYSAHVENVASCSVCHGGDINAKNKRKAHEGMFANPADFRVIDQTCASCHDDIVKSSMKSLHATTAGVISGARCTWGGGRTSRTRSLPPGISVTRTAMSVAWHACTRSPVMTLIPGSY
jgi:hypothetical protein